MKNRLILFIVVASLFANYLLTCSFVPSRTVFYSSGVSASAVAAVENGNNYIPRSVSINSSSTGLKGAETYPSYYSSADLGYTSSVDNQSTTEICWAFTHNELIEINLAKKNNVKYDFSEQTMKFETSTAIDSLYGFMRNPNDGGNESFSTAFLARSGSVLENDEPFSISEDRAVDGSTLSRLGRLESVPMYEFGVNKDNTYNEEAINTVKSIVTKYGAAGAALYYLQNNSYQGSSRINYYYDGTYIAPITDKNGNITAVAPNYLANHAVTIVGWDDNYSASNFANLPKGNGAFIVKNSWGLYHNNSTSDYVYVSYYDRHITNQLFTTDYTLDTGLYDNAYIYDNTGWIQDGMINGSSVLCATRFVADSSQETVTAIGTYITQPGVSARVMINTTGDFKNYSTYTTVLTKTFDAAGYYVLPISPVQLQNNEYYVAIQYTFSEGNASFAIQSNSRGYTDNCVNIPDTCFVSSAAIGINNAFSTLNAIENVYTPQTQIYNPMLCIKAFTKSGNMQQLNNISGFTDVGNSAWYSKAVDYAVGANLFSGVSNNSFEPDSQMSRAMFVRVLANLSNVDLSGYSRPNQFDDVESNRWYTGAVAWALKNEIVTGVTDTEFKPYDSITRQQMCVMLMRYARFLGIAFEYTYDGFRFDDDSGIQSYAKDAVYICRRYGIISGMTESTFEPAQNATRAQVSNLFMKFCKNYIY